LTTAIAGKHGFPAGCASSFLCDPGGQYSKLSHTLLRVLAEFAGMARYVALVAIVILAVVVVTAGRLRAMHRAQLARQARWIEICCPADVSATGGAVLWRLLATRLASGRIVRRRHRIGWELRATPAGVRIGLWVPPGVSAAAVAAAISEAWPGAQARTMSAMPARTAQPAQFAAIRLRPAAPDWLPICSLDRPLSRRELPLDADLLRVVFAALSECRSADISLGVQIVVRLTGRGHMRRSTAAMRRLRGLPPTLGLARRTPFAFFDLVTGTELAASRRAVISPQLAHPLGQVRLRALAAKAAAGPHFEVAVRVIASGGTPAVRRDLMYSVASGFGLVTLDAPVAVDLAVRRIWFPAGQIDTRYAPGRHRFTASLPEIAALARLPAEPARYGLKIAAARRIPPPPEVLAA
jgi:hypothetical protein